jgi:hypothetical protein
LISVIHQDSEKAAHSIINPPNENGNRSSIRLHPLWSTFAFPSPWLVTALSLAEEAVNDRNSKYMYQRDKDPDNAVMEWWINKTGEPIEEVALEASMMASLPV